MNKNLFLFSLCFLFLISSCKPNEKPSTLNYLQDVAQITAEVSLNNATATIQKGDELLIFVSAKNMEVVRPFNQNYYSHASAGSVSSPNTEKRYLVDAEGNIDFPVIGNLNTSGQSLEGFKLVLVEKISAYVKRPVVVVKLANFKVTVLGEVNRPGQYAISETSSTLLHVIGLAGDLTPYGKRNNILLVRSENGTITKERIDLMDPNFIHSPSYFLKQGDVIYVASNATKDQISKQNPNTGVHIALAGTLIGLAGIFITIFKK